jgi:hypothetical protein
MKNRLYDLNNHLFMQMERLSDEDLTGNKLSEEIHRGKALASIAKEIVAGASLALEAQKLLGDGLIKAVPDTLLLEVNHGKPLQ